MEPGKPRPVGVCGANLREGGASKAASADACSVTRSIETGVLVVTISTLGSPDALLACRPCTGLHCPYVVVKAQVHRYTWHGVTPHACAVASQHLYVHTVRQPVSPWHRRFVGTSSRASGASHPIYLHTIALPSVNGIFVPPCLRHRRSSCYNRTTRYVAAHSATLKKHLHLYCTVAERSWVSKVMLPAHDDASFVGG